MAERETSPLNHANNPHQVRVFVIGETGVGKSSLIEGFGAVNSEGKTPVVVKGGKEGTKSCEIFQTKDYAFVDTRGFGAKSAEPTFAATVLKNLLDFYLNNQDGFHVALFLVKNERYTAGSYLTFDVYRTILEGKKIPCALIVSCERHLAGQGIEAELMKEWSQEYPFVGGLYVDYDNIAKITDENVKNSAIKNVNQSNECLTNLLNEYRTKPVALYSDNSLLTDFYVLWNKICRKLGLSSFLCTKESIVKYLEMSNWSPSEARKASADFYNQLHSSIVSRK